MGEEQGLGFLRKLALRNITPLGVMARPEYASPVSITKNAPHPNAAKLFVDFLVSPEGQALYRDADYMPIDATLPSKVSALRPDGVRFRSIWFTPEHIENNAAKWTGIYNDMFR